MNESIDIEIEINAIMDALIANPVFLTRLRNLLLKDARSKGDVLGSRFSKPPISTAILIQPVANKRIQ